MLSEKLDGDDDFICDKHGLFFVLFYVNLPKRRTNPC